MKNKYLIYTGQVFLLAVVVLILYGHTLDVPFYLDDFSSIRENPVIYDWQGTFGELWHYAALRIVGYFTFALNFQFHQFQFAGYHIVNISIHFLTSCTVFALLWSLLQTPALKDNTSDTTKRWLPLIVALIFLAHPLQTQAVTYIVQRLASLAALFYIASMACFVQARLSKRLLFINLWLFTCTLFTLLAFFTKQNTATLPIALFLIEWVFFTGEGQRKRLLISGISAFVGVIIVWIILALAFGKNPFSLQAMEALTKETTAISRDSYLATQFSVLWTYIRLFFLPVDLHIDYSYPITAHLWSFKALFAFAGHLLLVSAAVRYFRRFPLFAFGILFYYLAHAVESSVIPIRDVAFEHRTYLPNLGLMILCAWWLIEKLPQLLDKKITQVIVLALLIVLSITTWYRNELWRNPVALWTDNVKHAPDKRRDWVILGKHLIQEGKPREAIIALDRAIEYKKNPDGSMSKTLSTEAMLNLIVAHKRLGEYDHALIWLNAGLNSKLSAFDRAKFLVNQGNVFYELRRYAESEASYREAVNVYPQSLTARANLASILAATGRFAEAEKMYLEILAIDPNNMTVKENLKRIKKMQ